MKHFSKTIIFFSKTQLLTCKTDLNSTDCESEPIIEIIKK